jgi:hypothetical protein
MNKNQNTIISYTSEAPTTATWYFSSERQAEVASEEFSNLKINEKITHDRVLLLDPYGKPIANTSKQNAINSADEIGFVAVEVNTSENESTVRLWDMQNEHIMKKKLGLRTKRRPWIYDIEKKIAGSEVCDAWPRSSEKEHQSISQHKVLTEHKDHTSIHKCSINKPGNIVGYRMSKIPDNDEKICTEPNTNLLNEILNHV